MRDSDVTPEIVALVFREVHIARIPLHVLVRRDDVLGLERVKHRIVALLTEVTRDVDLIIDSCTLHLQQALGLIALTLIGRFRNDTRREQHFVAVVELVGCLAPSHPSEHCAWLTLVTRHDRQEILHGDTIMKGKLLVSGERRSSTFSPVWKKRGMVDVFREQHGYGDLNILDVSHATQTGDPLAVSPKDIEGKRFDHTIASTELNPQECYYDQDGFACSDHAPMIATFAL